MVVVSTVSKLDSEGPKARTGAVVGALVTALGGVLTFVAPTLTGDSWLPFIRAMLALVMVFAFALMAGGGVIVAAALRRKR
ncbi:hypothetical protein [Pseudonocardia sp. D17]|uniref:hypothetical protein n=1 Tax=Pseudonocardia sp. D17 TaxID=882661 RepID=UPI002B3AA868|nr:hypothetical protein PSD17_03930 [Pseudonocardia sp. D17]